MDTNEPNRNRKKINILEYFLKKGQIALNFDQGNASKTKPTRAKVIRL